MFHQIRYQTGELDDVAEQMRKGSIPCMDVSDREEYGWVLEQLALRGITRLEAIPEDRNARDRLKEPEFEFRAAFSPTGSNDRLLYLDIYYEPDHERTYDPIGEIL
jgi:hypothetical protein